MSKNHFYSGIGSRSTPEPVLAQMSHIAGLLERLGLVLRSGGAAGADKAFESGIQYPENKVIFRPEHATEASMTVASKLHPFWPNMKDYSKRLHGRNAQIILGTNLDNPSRFVVCWTPDAALVGGTAMGIRLALQRGIPVFNLADPKQNAFLMEKLAKAFPKG